ncbi:type II toxin-antitoxin system HipA family toxin [Kineococcus rhizosphaerae]|uniref:Serine/threonine-protein kinase HipA n=1 Tax=Kineococcus rhizosphaerae TaxID=559628 RepID=A0A2T0QX18_9ACTN|nr:HipA domain-containing protein [Kineococcus rhizosphaerae]PRY10256.1 serine/threonine-protein kinase HipA [Kineococcus rhizosphaerae]
MGDLRVELYGTLVGHLVGDSRTFDLRVDPSVFDTFDLGSTVLSEAVPLDPVPARSRAARRRNFFAELLPEGRLRSRLASTAGVAESDVLGLLRHYGRDVAGALQIWDEGAPGEPRVPRAEPLTEPGVAELLRAARSAPLGNSPLSGRTSLAGVQDKIVLARLDDRWHRVHDGFPSTHIVKPVPEGYPTLIFDEEFGLRAARALGLAPYASWIEEHDGVPALFVERFDREPGTPVPQRIHQEDVNQVLGASGDEKYQEIGGRVSLRRTADVFRRQGDAESLRRLADLLVLTVGVGNLDLHAKNLGVLHPRDGSARLAPAYDVVPLVLQHTDGRLALAVNGRYELARVSADDLVAEITSWGLRSPGPRVHDVLTRLRAFLDSERPHERADPRLVETLAAGVDRLLAG